MHIYIQKKKKKKKMMLALPKLSTAYMSPTLPVSGSISDISSNFLENGLIVQDYLVNFIAFRILE